MDDYYRQLEHMLKTQLELQNGTYKRMPNEERLEKYNRELKKFQSMYKKDYYLINQTCTTDCKVGSTHKSFDNKMKPITVKEMTMGTTYKDKYIKFEIVTDLTMMTSIMFLGKDDNGDLVLIAIYNFENHYGTKDYKRLSYIFQKGKYILVLEPFYKMFGSGEDGIRIEDPNEIIIFDDKEWVNKFLKAENKEESFKLFHDDDDKNYDDLYKEAHKALCIENYNTALVHFIKLKSLKPEEIKFDMKIAECYFGIPYYSKTIEKCNEILNRNDINDNNKDKFHLNALKLKVKSLIKLKKIKEAKEELDKYIEIVDKNKTEFFEIEEEIKKKLKNMKKKII
jgi:tetratricopeptide (TPR) repeat protein